MRFRQQSGDRLPPYLQSSRSVRSKRNGWAGRSSLLNSGAGPQLCQAYRNATGLGTSEVANVIVPMLRLLIGMPNSVAL